MKSIIIGIVGSRRRNSDEDLELLLDSLIPVLERLDSENYEIKFVSGGCPLGGDRFAEIIANQFNIPIIIHYPDKSSLPSNPTKKDFAIINYARNTLIARDSNILFAVVAPDRKGGTEDTIKKFKKFHPKAPIVII